MKHKLIEWEDIQTTIQTTMPIKHKASVGKFVLSKPAPGLKKERTADVVQSGFLNIKSPAFTAMAMSETVRVLNGKPGQYHTQEAARKYPYGRVLVNFTKIPRIHFSKTISQPDDLPFSMQLRYDYDARFRLGTGPMAVDEDNRIIHAWSTTMEEMADTLWKAMKDDDSFFRHCKPGNEFNHVDVHLYRRSDSIKPHADRRRQQAGRQQVHNSMKEGTAVAVVTLGDVRRLSFYRKHLDDNGKLVQEPEPFCHFDQGHGCVFILDPRDEEVKIRRNFTGRKIKGAIFVHGVKCGKDKDYVSVAFVFRCVDKTAIVDTNTDRVVQGEPQNRNEKKRRFTRARQRERDSRPGSAFETAVTKTQGEWHRLFKKKGWV